MAIIYVTIDNYLCKFNAKVERLVEKAEMNIGVENQQQGKVVSGLRLGPRFSRVVELEVCVVAWK